MTACLVMLGKFLNLFGESKDRDLTESILVGSRIGLRFGIWSLRKPWSLEGKLTRSERIPIYQNYKLDNHYPLYLFWVFFKERIRSSLGHPGYDLMLKARLQSPYQLTWRFKTKPSCSLVGHSLQTVHFRRGHRANNKTPDTFLSH